jgi:hypothetical protein
MGGIMNNIQERSPIVVILLSVITCGLYALYWIYKMSEEIQMVEKERESTSPGLELLLCIVTCGLYTYYWYYKYAKKIYVIQEDLDIRPAEDNGILYIILAVFQLHIISMAIMQASFNKVILTNVDGY